MSAALNAKLHQARTLLHSGDVLSAVALCNAILSKAPRNPEALSLRGMAALMQGDYPSATTDLRLALQAKPNDGATLEYLGLALLNQSAFSEAASVLQRAAQQAGAPASVWMRLGLAHLHAGAISAAIAPLRKAVALAPQQADTHINLGRGLAAYQDPQGAQRAFETALTLAPGHPTALYNLGVLALTAKDLTQAQHFFTQVVAREPRHTDALINLGIVLEQHNDSATAAQHFKSALQINPHHPHAHSNLGRLFLRQQQWTEAHHHFTQAIEQDQQQPIALEGLATIARAHNRYEEASNWCEALLQFEPEAAHIWAFYGDCLLQIGKLDTAQTAAEKALSLDPQLGQAYSLLAQLHIIANRIEASIKILQQGTAQTANPALLSLLCQQARYACDWPLWQATWAQLKPHIDTNPHCGSPFVLLCEDLDANAIGRYTQAWARQRFGAQAHTAPPARDRKARGERLRIGYFSSDFQEHPVGYLMIECLEHHDRSQFEVFIYSYGRPQITPMRARYIAAVEHFVDISHIANDAAIAQIAADEIDILIDLKGYTLADRLEIMAARPSPIQVTWLGYPGTTGTDFIDYLIADPHLIHPHETAAYSERVIRLPQCYQPNDRLRTIDPPLARSAYELPEAAVVLCSFNQSYKITPEIYAVWLAVLHAAPESVLWLLDANPLATAHLHAQAQAAGIDPARIIIAPKLPLAAHLARYQVADLALDTFPYTSHTTASDALWCGCPLVALRGETFAARVSASILSACGLDAYITDNLGAYQRLLITLSTDATALATARTAAANARHAALFDTPQFTRDWEALLWQMQSEGVARSNLG